jgi:hypothetical protein
MSFDHCKLNSKLKQLFNRLPLFIACILSVLAARAQTIGYIDTSKVHEFRINPRAALAEEVEADDVLNNVEYIPLETTNKSLFGKIDQLAITNDYYIILDTYSSIVNYHPISSILIFTKTGAFHARIDASLTYLFAIDYLSHEIVISEGVGSFFTRYDFDGKLVKKQAQPFIFNSFVYTPSNLVAYFRNFQIDGSLKPILITNQQKFSNILLCKPDFEFDKVFLPFDTVGNKQLQIRQGNSHYFTTSFPDIYFHLPYKFDFFSLDNDKLTKRFHFVFPLENSLPVDFLTSREFQNKRVQHLNSFPNEFFDMTDFYKTNNTIAFTLFSGRMIKSFLYNLKSNLLTSFSSIKTNSKNVIVPFDKEIVGSDGTVMYSWLRAADFFKGNKSLSTVYEGSSIQLKEFLKNGSARSNPVLIKFKTI